MKDVVFETCIVPISSAKGSSVLLLDVLGICLCLSPLQADPTKSYAAAVAIGLFCLLAAFCLRFGYQDFAVDKVMNRYRHFHQMWGVRMGYWEELPSIDGVVMKYFSAYTTPTGNGNTEWGIWNNTGATEWYIVMLSTENPSQKGIIVHRFPFDKKEDAAQLTTELASYLAVPTHFYERR